MSNAGRPTLYTEELADRICEKLMDGMSLRRICESDEFPSRQTVVNWQIKRPDFLAKCARSRELQADLMDDLILDAAKECTEDNYQSTRIKISAYQWRAAKLAPKKYGDMKDLGQTAIAIQITGGLAERMSMRLESGGQVIEGDTQELLGEG